MSIDTVSDMELKAALRRIDVLERNLKAAEEAGKRMAKQLIQVERERGDLLVCLAELEGQEPVAYIDNGTGRPHWYPGALPNNLPHGAKLYARPAPAEEGLVTVTTDDTGRCVMVSRQDEDHRILSVIWQAEG